MNTNSRALAMIAGITFVVATALFLIVEITALYIIAYIFVLLGVAAIFISGSYLLKNAKAYPWAAAIPMAALWYFAAEVVFSAVFVILQQFGAFTLPTVVFIVAHIVILAFFMIRIVMLHAGKAEIERVEEKAKANTFDWKMLIADLEALASKSREIKPVLDAIKYSDPVTSPALAEYDEKIRDGVTALENAVDAGDGAKISELCVMLQRQVKDRNNKAKL